MSCKSLAALGLALLLAGATAGAAADVPGRREAERGYRAALLAWSRGEEAVALETLASLERPLAGGGAMRYGNRLRRLERSLAAELAARAPESLLPFAALHVASYERHVRERQSLLTLRSRAVVDEVVELYLRRSREPRRAAGGAAAWSEIAARLQGHHQESAAAQAYERALAAAPRHLAALAGLAVVREKQGQVDAAHALLERAAALAPGHREVRLRLAVVSARRGDPQRARLLLAGLAGDRGGDWIAAVAAQELAVLLAAEGRTREALAVVERALEVAPCDPVLPLRRRALEERLGKPPDVELAVALARCAGRSEPSPRTRYNRAEPDELLPPEDRLAAWEVPRRPVLAAALEGRR